MTSVPISRGQQKGEKGRSLPEDRGVSVKCWNVSKLGGWKAGKEVRRERRNLEDRIQKTEFFITKARRGETTK